MTRKEEPKDPTEGMPISIPLSRARLCVECEVIWQANGRTTCPSCGSAVYWSMGGKLLSGQVENDPNSATGTEPRSSTRAPE